MLNILLVDDEREEREGIAWLIRKFGFPLAVTQAPNGKKALEQMEQSPADILFTDVKMPLMNGLELAKAVNGRFPETKIIIFSAYGEFEYARQALEANAVNYLLKPIEVEEFRRVMEELLDTIAEERSRREEKRREDWQNRKNVFYKLLTGAPVQPEERRKAENELFGGSACCRLLHVEFMNSFYERYEELFLHYVQMYLGGQTEYVNLFQSESCLLIRDREYMDREFLEGQLMKLSRDVKAAAGEGMFIVVGRIAESIGELEREVESIQSIRRETLGHEDMIVWAELAKTKAYYSRDVETIRRQLMLAVESSSTELIRRFSDELAEAVAANNMVSRLYVQNLFYTVIQAIYNKNPDLHYEKILNSSDILFQSRNAKEVIRLFRQSIGEMLDGMTEKGEDDLAVIQKIKHLVEKEYMYDLSLNEVAERVNLAPAYVSYIFSRETGTTLIKYITEKRMEKAKLLLEEGKLKMVQIARACGYESQSYFNRAFKNHFGVTPKQYKEGQNG